MGEDDSDRIAQTDAGKRYAMPARPGSHDTFAQGSDLVVEWYDFGPHAPYESANLLIFDPAAQRHLAVAIDAPSSLTSDQLAERVAARFASYFAVKSLAEAQSVRYTQKVEFQP